jgi:hypothetical protein
MASATDKPTSATGPADDAASWVAAAERFVADAPPSKVAKLDFTWRSLSEVDLLVDMLTSEESSIGLKTRLGLAAYIGEVLVRQFGGHWASGEHYGEVLAPEAAVKRAKAQVESAQPTQMVEKRLVDGLTLQHQVFEQTKAWAVENGVVATTTDLDGPSSMMRLVADTFVKPAVQGGAIWLDYSAESVDRLDALIAESWPGVPEKGTYGSMVPAIGAYVGEVLVKQTGARWIRDPEEGYGVELNGQVAFPMSEVGKRFELGPEHSIGRFYRDVSGRWLLSASKHGQGDKRGLFGRGRG